MTERGKERRVHVSSRLCGGQQDLGWHQHEQLRAEGDERTVERPEGGRGRTSVAWYQACVFYQADSQSQY